LEWQRNRLEKMIVENPRFQSEFLNGLRQLGFSLELCAESENTNEFSECLWNKSIVERRTANLHPLELENIYSLSNKGVRVYSLLRTLAEREVALWESFKKVWR